MCYERTLKSIFSDFHPMPPISSISIPFTFYVYIVVKHICLIHFCIHFCQYTNTSQNNETKAGFCVSHAALPRKRVIISLTNVYMSDPSPISMNPVASMHRVDTLRCISKTSCILKPVYQYSTSEQSIIEGLVSVSTLRCWM